MTNSFDFVLPDKRPCGHQCTASAAAGDDGAHCCRCRAAQEWFELTRSPYGRSHALIAQAEDEGWCLPSIEQTHAGWHAGLRRPSVRASTPLTGDGPIIRTYDTYGVVSGRGPDETYFLCGVCRSSLRSTPEWLFWHARGWSATQARLIATQEERLRRGPACDPATWPVAAVPWASSWNAEDVDSLREPAGAGDRWRAAAHRMKRTIELWSRRVAECRGPSRPSSARGG